MLEIDSHSQDGEVVTLHLAGGTIQVHSNDVDRIENRANLVDSPKAALSPVIGAAPKAADLRTIRDYLASAGTAQGLPPSLMLSVAKAESGLHPTAVSPKGALGLMQLMPSTASALGVRPALPDENALGGAIYLRSLLLKYKGDAALALAAYNAGPGAVSKYRGVPPYAETRRYIERVLNEYERLEKIAASKAIP